MTDHLFDKFVRDKLGDYSSPVPDKLWSKIEQDMERRRRPAFYWLLGVFLLAAISGGYLFWQNSLQSPAKNAKADNKLTPVPPGQSGPDQTSNVGTAEDKIKNDSSSNDLVHDNNATQQINNSSSTNNNTTTGYYTNMERGNNTERQLTLSSAGNSDDNNTSTLTPNSDFKYNEDAETRALGMGEILATDKSKNLYTTSSILNKKSNMKMPDIRCPVDRDRGNSDWFVEAYLSPSFASKITQSNIGTTNTYLAKKDSAEKMQLSYSAGIRLSKPFGDHFMMKAGIQYTQVNEKFNYKIENERKQVTVITTHTVVNAPGDTTYVKDTSSYEQIGYRQRSVTNRFKSVDVPVILGYEWGNNGWRFAVNGGAIFNVYSWYNGEIYDTSFNAMAVDKSPAGVYKRNIGVGLYGSISIFKSIGENTEIFAEPYLRYNLSNMMEANQSYSQKFRIGGLSLGIRYKLSGRQR
ncbi:MAG: hypothetical protein J0I41_01490 [Filimonas sp.]|nr:hypothetical protein [Filimonas sp.]